VKRPPWTSGPAEILEHGISLLNEESDKNRRLAMLTIDNAVELMIKTYLSLPKRATGIKMSRSDFQNIRESFPKLLDALEHLAADRLRGIDLADLEWYHRLRNQLYHQGNGLTVEKDKVIAYAQIAKTLFKNLFKFEVSLRDSTVQEPLAAFLSNWGRIESAVFSIADRLGMVVSSGKHPHVGSMSLIQGLTKTEILSKQLEHELGHYRQLRNKIVHQGLGESGTISNKEVKRLAEIADEIEQIFYNITNKKPPIKINKDFDKNRLSEILEELISKRRAKTLAIEIESQLILPTHKPNALSEETEKRLLRWAHPARIDARTKFVRPKAREICEMLYGFVPDREN
jgi:hypothetical protein